MKARRQHNGGGPGPGVVGHLFRSLAIIALWGAAPLLAQNAELSGLIRDPGGLAVPDARVVVESRDTGGSRRAVSSGQGIYSVPALLPGTYNITVEATGFKTIHQDGVAIEVDQRARLDFRLTLGGTTDSIIVQGNAQGDAQGSAPLLNTSDASVSTMIGNQFVENLPLNGRSFSSLIDLTPGVVLTAANLYDQGQFSVNGQRPDTNYFLVDGVSANLGNAGSGSELGQGGAGQLPALSAFGGTSNLVSLDALDEFRIQTSTFAPEYGRTPGAQVSVVTKSGTNTFHGTAFEYFRNDVLDANDWFANCNGLARPELRQNDFGGVLGGPIRRPSAKNARLFFFGSYEGLRVRQPRVADTFVPSLATIQKAPALVQPLLNAFPKPNGPDFGNGTAAFSASYSDPSLLNSSSVRIDYLPSQSLTVFGRYSDAPSAIDQRAPEGFSYSSVQNMKYRTQSLTLGTNQALTPRLTNEFRFNYSRSRANSFVTLDNFGNAVPVPDSALYAPSVSPQNSAFLFYAGAGLAFVTGELGDNLQRQINVTDNVSRVIGAHRLKFGLDYRRLNPQTGFAPYTVQYLFLSLSNVLADTVPQASITSRTGDVQLLFSNWSLFAQDTWQATHTLTITYGLRWEYNAAPSSPNGTLPFTVMGDNPSTMTLAPPGTPLWKPQKDDFAPRLGIAWRPLANLVLRAGAGLFYDLGYSAVADGANAFPYAQGKTISNTSFPLSPANAAPPPYSTSPPVPYLAVVDPNHVLPRTYEWNAAAERTLGAAGVITVTYLGAAGRKLMRQDLFETPNPSFTGEFDLMKNDADSSYQALQAQFRHRLARGLQTLFSYTWAHSIDDASSDAWYLNVPLGDSPSSQERASSDYDIRQTLSGAVSWNIPAPRGAIGKRIFGNWSMDSIVYARTGLPVNVVTGLDTFGTGFLSGADGVARPDLVSGVPLWIADPDVAGGREINPAAFTVPSTGEQGTLGRNALRGFDATQIDLTLRRQFRLREGLFIQARADVFNISNHPNFANPANYLTSPQFGQATQMLGASLGSGGQSGGLNPLYQMGGPRSAQLALKLRF